MDSAAYAVPFAQAWALVTARLERTRGVRAIEMDPRAGEVRFEWGRLLGAPRRAKLRVLLDEHGWTRLELATEDRGSRARGRRLLRSLDRTLRHAP